MMDIGSQFRDLHRPGQPFILANAWDIGSAKVLSNLGAEAIGTTSSGHAFTLGLPDMGHVSRDQAMAHAQEIVAATHLPVSGDFENGYGADPDRVAETVRMAAEIGLAGCSIEDTDMPGTGAYDRDHSVERIRAAVAAAHGLSSDFILVARADGVMNGAYDFAEAIARIRAYDAAGADCLYVPMPPSLEDLKRLCAATQKPINALAVGPYARLSRAAFAAAGVARISLGSGLARYVQTAMIDAARNIIRDGNFNDIGNAMPGTEVEALLLGRSESQ